MLEHLGYILRPMGTQGRKITQAVLWRRDRKLENQERAGESPHEGKGLVGAEKRVSQYED